ncbi:MAG: Smr/MutS family protein [Rhodothermales bacterium]|nr:Smr/MutS family protein [Rhodothermales bacterium]
MTRLSPDAPKSVTDDGRTVSIDVHGCSREEALRLIRQCVVLASARARDRVEVIHGIGGVIEQGLRSALSSGGLSGVTGSVTLSGRTVISLPLSGNPDRRRIGVSDLV